MTNILFHWIVSWMTKKLRNICEESVFVCLFVCLFENKKQSNTKQQTIFILLTVSKFQVTHDQSQV